MKTASICLTIGLILLPSLPVLSADGILEGEIGVTGMLANVNGNKAKFNEYRDIMDGVYGGARLKYDTDNFFAKGTASDIAYDTQKYRVEGGMYGKFKAYLDYTEIPHNFTYGARTFYNGAGTNSLSFTGPASGLTNTSTWKSFDYDLRRRTFGGGFSLDVIKPFFLDVSYSRETKTGNYPTGIGLTTPGGPSLELPQHIDYITNTLNVQAGYAKNPFYAGLFFMYQNFDDANSALYFINPSGPAGNRDAYSLPPDNQYYKLAFKGSVKLPLNTKFNINLAASRTTSEANLFTSYVTSTVTNIALSDTTFNGKVNTQNYNFVLTSNPVPWLIGKLYYKYYDKENKSDQIVMRDPGFAGGAPFTNPLFDYTKNNFGVDLEWSLPANFQLSTSYAWTKINRARGDLPETIDNKYQADLKWTGLDFITPKVGYEYMRRTADAGVLVKEYGTATSGDQATENYISQFLRRFDAAPLSRDIFKASVDIYPMANLNLGFAYRLKHDNYKKTVLGLKSSRSHDIEVDAGYSIGKIARISAYYDLERSLDDQVQRIFTIASGVGTVTNDWKVKSRDNSYAWGASTEVYLVPKILTLILQHDNVKSNGFLDFSYLTGTIPAGRNNDNIDIGNWDDYRLTSYIVKFKYTPTKHYIFTAGYAYEHYKYSDASFDNYALVSGTYPPGNSTTALLTGAYANPNYSSNVFFAAVSYRF
ncbi:MAG TPA: MtrB/PioB family decaheme-associated outer membrane protein [Dissulfurispiraceae bacterium]|nr:MtrB/PioB family decaheme-associated outer membrane protein [Dissulfurispiraceae bacterium]